MPERKDVVVIGSGLTGLSVGVKLHQGGIDVLLLEREERIGGQIRTLRRDGFVFETGPCTGSLSTPEVAELFEILGSDFRPETADQSARCRLICKGGCLWPLPASPWQGLTTPLFSFADKLRVLGEPWRKRGKDPNESVGSLSARRLGRSFVAYAVDPFVGGIYAGDPYKLCTRYALPKLYGLEADYGSFVRGAIAKARKPKTERDRKATKEVFSTAGGLSTLTERAADYIGRERIRCAVDILSIAPLRDGGFAMCYRDTDGSLRELETNRIVSTVGAYAVPQLFPFLPEADLAVVRSLRYAPIVQVAIGYNDRPTTLPRSFGALIPSVEKRRILGVLFPSDFFSARAPKGAFLCSVFIGGTRNPELTELDDQAIEQLVRQELEGLLAISQSTAPTLLHISRHPRAIPQYYADSAERLAVIDRIESEYPGLYLAGGLRDGIGMANRIAQGMQIADLIIASNI